MASFSDKSPNKLKPTIYNQDNPLGYVPPGVRHDWMIDQEGDPDHAPLADIKPGVFSGISESSMGKTVLAIGALAGTILAIQPVGERLYKVYNPDVEKKTHVVPVSHGVPGSVEFRTQTTEAPEIAP